jgi:hypothetical protein
MRFARGIALNALLWVSPAAAQREEIPRAGSDPVVVVVGDASRASFSGAAYEPPGFNLRPAVTPTLRLVRGAGALTFSALARYGQSLVDTERYGLLRADAVLELAPGWGAGVEALGMFDLEIDDDEPLGEPAFDLRSGPLLVFAGGPLRVVASGGVQRFELRFAEARLGAVAMLGVGVGL